MSKVDDFEAWVKSAGTQHRDLLKLIAKGDLRALNVYSNRLGTTMARLMTALMQSPEFQSLSNVEKAQVVRYSLGEGALKINGLTSAATFTAMTAVLKKRGLVMTAARSDDASERLKGVVGVSLLFLFDKNDPVAAVNSLSAGTQQVVNYGVRSGIVNTSEKVRKATGEPLKGKRLVVSGNDACDYCKQFAGRVFAVEEEMPESHFHDYCNCQLVID